MHRLSMHNTQDNTTSVQFSGAMLLGRGVTDTIKSGIVQQSAFEDAPEILLYGMYCALMAAALWLILATALELPVSTTHAIFGCALPLWATPALHHVPFVLTY
jgi:phosphate/sulfate permease